jgi:hypothetical protein
LLLLARVAGVLPKTLHHTTALNELSNRRGKRTLVVQICWRLCWQPLTVGAFRAFDGGEADVVLLNNGGVQRVEIQKKDELVVETSLGLKDETSGVSGLGAFVTSVFVLDLLGQDVVQRVESMKQEILNTLRSGSL